MGLNIETDSFGAYPWPIVLTLWCDGCIGDETAQQRFSHRDGFIGAYKSAISVGWKDTHRDGKRVFLGPCCSGKVNKGEGRSQAAKYVNKPKL